MLPAHASSSHALTADAESMPFASESAGSVPKVALITGGARRLGAAMTRVLHAAGLQVVLHYRHSGAEAAQLAAELNALRPHSVHCLAADLLDLAALSRLATAAEAVHGRLDFLVNNASTYYPTPLGQWSAAAWEDLIGTNFKAPLFLTQACAPAICAAGGAVVNIVDIHAQRPPREYALYASAKAGLWAATLALAQELAPRARVNGVAPGAILMPEDTANVAGHADMLQRTPLGREGQPQDIARTVRFLLLDAPYITGQILAVDGGRSLR
jgi:pteridine reductase